MSETVPKRICLRARQYPDSPFSYDKDTSGEFVPTTFADTWRMVQTIGAGLATLGVSRGDHVGLISHNRQEWIRTDLAILGLGAVDVPRGSDSTTDEIAYILAHADCRLCVAENPEQCEKIVSKLDELPKLEHLVLYEDYSSPAMRPKIKGVRITSFEELIAAGAAQGENGQQAFNEALEAGTSDDLATILYTSGTTGEPKGVMLRHRSFLFQMDRLEKVLFLTPRDIFLAVLPVWHSFERAVEYVCLNYGASLAYSKPIGKIMLEDMAKIRPTWMTSVPRIWEGIRSAVLRNVSRQSVLKQALFHFFVGVGEIHANLLMTVQGRLPRFQKRNRVVDALVAIVPLVLITPFRILGNVLVFRTLQRRFGGRFVAGVSGGGALPPYVDTFFQALGILILEGYGLTETGPVLAVRAQRRPVPGTVGKLLPDIEYRVVGEDGRELGPGEKGELHVRSEQVMEGYYKKPEETAAVLSNGWLNTGDLVLATYDGEIRIVGRSKETIVLLGGENIEPQPIEDAILQSPAIDQVMVVGQDQKFLGALVIPNEDEMLDYARRERISYVETDEILNDERFRSFIHDEIQSRVNGNTGFKGFEQVFRSRLLDHPFTVGEELTQTMKIKRAIVAERCKHEIADLFR